MIELKEEENATYEADMNMRGVSHFMHIFVQTYKTTLLYLYVPYYGYKNYEQEF